MKTKIKEIREEQGISQHALAMKSNISRAVISDLETGKAKNITVGTMKKISNALGKEISEIFSII